MEIHYDNKELVQRFIDIHHSESFRYFQSRSIEAIKNHLVTLVVTYNGDIVGYGHIDFEKVHWIGICVLEKYQGQGYGSLIMKTLMGYTQNTLYLTVDKSNKKAINLYTKYGFKILDEKETYYRMCFQRS